MPDTILHATMLFAFGFAGAPSSGKIPPLFPVPGKPVFFEDLLSSAQPSIMTKNCPTVPKQKSAHRYRKNLYQL